MPRPGRHVGAVDGEALAASGVDDVAAVGVAEGTVEGLGIVRMTWARAVPTVSSPRRKSLKSPFEPCRTNPYLWPVRTVREHRRMSKPFEGVVQQLSGPALTRFVVDTREGATDNDRVEPSGDVEPRVEASPVKWHGHRSIGARGWVKKLHVPDSPLLPMTGMS